MILGPVAENGHNLNLYMIGDFYMDNTIDELIYNLFLNGNICPPQQEDEPFHIYLPEMEGPVFTGYGDSIGKPFPFFQCPHMKKEPEVIETTCVIIE